jgi:hypothetical protein
MSLSSDVVAELNDTRAPYTLPGVAGRLSVGEGKCKKLAKRALREGRLRPEAERVWRGWLGMDGEAATTSKATAPAPKADADGGTSLMDMGEPVRISGPGITAERKADEETSKPKRRTFRKASYHRLVTAPTTATYGDLVRLYLGDRTLKDPEDSLRRFVSKNAANLPAHIVIKVCPNKAKWLGLADDTVKLPLQRMTEDRSGWPKEDQEIEKLHDKEVEETAPRLPEGTDPQVEALHERISNVWAANVDLSGKLVELMHRFESHQETTRSRFNTVLAWLKRHDERLTLLTGQVHANALSIDALDDELGLSHKPRRHLTIRLGQRIVKALGAFWRTLVSGNGNSEEEDDKANAEVIEAYGEGHPLHARGATGVDEVPLPEERDSAEPPPGDARQ